MGVVLVDLSSGIPKQKICWWGCWSGSLKVFNQICLSKQRWKDEAASYNASLIYLVWTEGFLY